MKNRIFLAVFLLGSFGVVEMAMADGGHINLGQPTFGGPGCADGTVAFVLSPDEQELSILFDDFRVEAGNGTATETKTCQMIVPITAPAGFQIHVQQADYRGFNSLPAGATSELHTQYNFDGDPSRTQKRLKPFRGPLQDEFLDTVHEHAKSPCGKRVIFRVETFLTVSTNAQQDQAFSQIDTEDRSIPRRRKDRKMKFQVRLKRCD